jgi:hypothetical protein
MTLLLGPAMAAVGARVPQSLKKVLKNILKKVKNK